MGQVQDSDEDQWGGQREAENRQRAQQMLDSSDAYQGNQMAKQEAFKRQKVMQEQNPMDCENEQTLE